MQFKYFFIKLFEKKFLSNFKIMLMFKKHYFEIYFILNKIFKDVKNKN